MLYEEMDEEMEDVFQQSFQCFEMDLDYEFDASRFFDFTRPESPWEARAAELWFETAACHLPSRKINPRNFLESFFLPSVNLFRNVLVASLCFHRK